MTNRSRKLRRRQKAQNNVGAVLEPLVGKTLAHAGTCPDCDADATAEKDADGIYRLITLHDDSCPWLAAREARIAAVRAQVLDAMGEGQ